MLIAKRMYFIVLYLNNTIVTKIKIKMHVALYPIGGHPGNVPSVLRPAKCYTHVAGVRQHRDYWEYIPMCGRVGNQRWRSLSGSR